MFWSGGCNRPHEDAFWKGLKLEGFEKTSILEVYNKDNLFDYMNGEAEVYFSFGFQLLYVQIYRGGETGANMIMESYNMGTSAGAQGIFGKYAHENGTQIKEIGESAWTDNHIILFRSGKYFLRIWPDPSSEAEIKPSLKDQLSLSQALEGALKNM
jgi:hypothetical protein